MGAVLFATSCSLDQDPISDFSEITVGGKDTTDTSVKFKTKEEMKTQYDGIYKAIQNAQEAWYADMLVLNETHSDNAYCGSSGADLPPSSNRRRMVPTRILNVTGMHFWGISIRPTV